MGALQDKCEKNQFKNEINFTLNGEVHTVNVTKDVSPKTSLNTYLRTNLGICDTKTMCREGGCGVCVISATFYNSVFREKRTYAINSCLIPIFSCHNWEIVTNTSLGNRKKGYHKIQETLAEFGGSQCGFCSSGMVMNMYTLMQNKGKLKKDVEDAFGGHLCRCTGYRPIMDAFTFLVKDIEDLTPDICTNCPNNLDKICIDFNSEMFWIKLYVLKDVLKLFKHIGNDSYRFVAGNTAKGVYPLLDTKYWIDLRDIQELTSYSLRDKSLHLGANLTINDTIEIFRNISSENGFQFLEEICKHFELIANVSVRNFGTLAGNLSIKHKHPEFPSDIFLLFETIGAHLIIVQGNGIEVQKNMCDYLNFNMNKSIIKCIVIPRLEPHLYVFKSFKIMPRSQNAHAYVNAAFLMEHDGNYNIKSGNIVYGGISGNLNHATEAEAFLKDKQLFDNEIIGETLNIINKELQQNVSNDFKIKLAKNLFYKFILAVAPKTLLSPANISGGLALQRPEIQGVQFYQTNEKMYPVTQPVRKLEGLGQTSGEVQYIDDIPKIPGELFGAFVLAETLPLSRIKKIDFTKALEIPGVVAFLDHKDIPGDNLFCGPPLLPTKEELFCSGNVLYNGQPVGLIIADTQEKAFMGVDLVEIEYETSHEKPFFTIKDVLAKDPSRIQNLSTVEPSRRGDQVKHIIKGSYEMKGQYHFTMETQNCVCVPRDDGTFDLFAGSQWMNLVQKSAASALNIPMSKINVVVKRLGGGFGAKLLRCSMISTACAVAANNLGKPVRVSLPLETNMKMLGKRFPFYAEYETGVDENGMIQYLDTTLYQDSGTSGSNEQMVAYMGHYMKSAYVHDTWKISGNLVRTDMPGNAYARGPGSTEAISLIETIMEHISHELNKNPLEVRLVNLAEDQSEIMRPFLEDIATFGDFKKRQKQIEEFNHQNKWIKKGLSFVLMNHRFVIFHPYSVMVSIFAGDGTVAISHGGIECGQGINTKVVQCCAYELNIPMDWITIKPSLSYVTPNNQMTGGSVTSEAVCYATLKACKELKQRLEPIKSKLENPENWKELVWKAFQEDVELCAIHSFTSTSEEAYNIPGACICEAQVDLLTGQYTINRVDLMEDVGSSINPFIDVGQIEGAFIMGLGLHTCENLIYGQEGEILTNNTWSYKIPGVKDIPADFRIKFKVDGVNPNGVLNSKACGEPALNLAIGVPFAIRNAIASPGQDFIKIDGPTTVEFTLCNISTDENYTL